MPYTTDWEQDKFNELFDDEINVLSRRIAHDATCTIADLEGTLQSLYVIEGNNMAGRSRVQEIALEATIAAYEKFIHDWKNNRK